MALLSNDCERGNTYGPVPLQPAEPERERRRREPCGVAPLSPHCALLRGLLVVFAVACLVVASRHVSWGQTSLTGRKCTARPCRNGRQADEEAGSVPIFLNHRPGAGAAVRDAISLVGSGSPGDGTAEKDDGVAVLENFANVTSDTVCKWVLGLPPKVTVEKVWKLADHWEKHGVKLLYVGDSGIEGLAVVVIRTTLKKIRKILERYPKLTQRPQYVEMAPPLHMRPQQPSKVVAPGAASVQEGTKQVLPPSWGLDRIDQRALPLDDAFDPATTPASTSKVHVYVMDTGIRTTHAEFEGRAIPTLETFEDLRKCSEEDTTCADDKHGHGTHVAATVGGRSCGVAKGSTLHAVKTLKDDGLGDWASIAIAINWVLAYGERPAIMQMSISGPGEVGFVMEALESAASQGITVVVAAGNNGGEDACEFTPSLSSDTIRVGAIQEDNSRAGYSNIGDCVDIFAPGTKIVSASNADDVDLTEKNGTSMATPHVTGAAALLLAEDPTLKPADIRARLVADATAGVIRDAGANSPNLLLCTGHCTAEPSASVKRKEEAPPGVAEESVECGQGWRVSTGPCSMDVECCAQSPRYPKSYGSKERCVITTGPSPGPIEVMAFSTELGFDKLTINSKEYHGVQMPPDGLVPHGEIIWSSDFSVEGQGWKLCMPARGSKGGQRAAAKPAAAAVASNGGAEDPASTSAHAESRLFGVSGLSS